MTFDHRGTLRASGSSARALRIMLYGQSLSGTGHFVRIYEIARALAVRHQVHLIDGGRPVPRPRPANPFALVDIPRVCRRDGQIVPVDPGPPIGAVMTERWRLLAAALERIRPDVVVIEHFPFSKWDLRVEILPLIERARAVAPNVRVLGSVRDIPPGTGEDPGDDTYRDRVLGALETHFDGLLVHTDPALMPFHEPIPWADRIAVPVACTGYVSEKLDGRPSPVHGPVPYVVVSTGGAHLPDLVDRTLEAWRRLGPGRGGRELLVFLPPFTRAVPRPADDPSVRLTPFTADFLPWLAGADLSISQAGYNTCANVLETGTRAIVVPSGAMADQGPRARRLAARGLVDTIPAADLAPERLAAAMGQALAGPRARHNVDLDGAARACTQIEAWCAEPRAAAFGRVRR